MAQNGPAATVTKLDQSENISATSESKWDNGFYAASEILGMKTGLLIDSGSSCTLLSYKIYQDIPETNKPSLSQETFKMTDVKGTEVKVYGSARVKIKLGNTDYLHKMIICDIATDGILGQDFLLENVKRIDYEKYLLYTKHDEVTCWLGAKSSMICRVLVKEQVNIPANSSAWVPVAILNKEHLSSTILVEPVKQNTCAHLVPGVVDTETEKHTSLNVVNPSDEPLTLYSKTVIGTCQSASDNENIDKQKCRHVKTADSMHSENEKDLPEYLRDLFIRSSSNLNESEKIELKTLLTNYQDVFAKSSDDLGLTDKIEHKIPVKEGTVPIKQPVRRIPAVKREIERTEIQKMVDRKIIEPSVSPWCSNLVIVTRKDKAPRICVDYRKVNETLKKDSYPLPRMDDCIDSLTGMSFFSTMDLCSGYWQIGIAPEDREITAFATSMGLYQFVRMPFGMAVGPSVFCRLMGEVLRGMQWTECIAYMDDIVVPSKSVTDNLVRLEHVFQRLRDAKLKLKPSKCHFLQRSIRFLGHIVSEQGVKTDPEKVKAIQEWTTPKNVKQVRSFVGLAAYYKKFIEGFSEIAKPLYKLCEKNRKYEWTSECQIAMDQLKMKLSDLLPSV